MWLKDFFSLANACIIVLGLISSASLSYAQDDTQVTSDPWSDNQLIEPQKLADILLDSLAVKPLILHVGVPFQFAIAHISGAKHTGMASRPEGIEALKKEVKELPRDKEIILYCGCCPWKNCPNIRPAFKVMQNVGFTKVKVLYISKNFQKDWINKNLPVDKGSN
jgi:thiosulfate/3-mercaptopyruvate sulfurtransferase